MVSPSCDRYDKLLAKKLAEEKERQAQEELKKLMAQQKESSSEDEDAEGRQPRRRGRQAVEGSGAKYGPRRSIA